MAKPPQSESFLAWCFNPYRDAPKHKTWNHPIFCMILMLSLCVAVCTLLSNYFEAQVGYQIFRMEYETRIRWASFLGIYFAILFFTRVSFEGSKTVYDMLWGCNVCILLSIYGLIVNKPLILGACLITISCDQMLWYVDFITYIIFRKFKVGVAGYLLWPEVPFANKLTSTHHLWFMPLLGWVLKDVGGLRFEAKVIAVCLTVVLWIIARATVPKTIIGHKDKEVYMNINLSWELWKDIKVDWLRKIAKDTSYLTTLVMSLFIWNTLNFLAFFLLKALINLFSSL